MKIPLFIVDAFTTIPFKGNQAGVCVLTKKLDDQTLQQIAFEMNFSETAFISLINEKGDFSNSNTYNLRWFTPTNEINLCGHATLASAFILFTEYNNTSNRITFETLSGELHVSKEDNFYVMNFPVNEGHAIGAVKELQELLGLSDNDINAWLYDPVLTNILIEIQNDEILKRITPDFTKLKKYEGEYKLQGVMVTTKMLNSKYDFSSRFFLPWIGINEDPVTGASHTTLGPYWSRKLGKKNLFATQLSKRTGELIIQLAGDRTLIKGNACITLRGEFIL